MSTLGSRLLDLLFTLTHPRYWMMINHYSQAWDGVLTYMLDQGERFTNITRYEAYIGGTSVWVANYPYGAFTVGSLRPRRRTIHRAWKRLQSDHTRQLLNNYLRQPF